MPAKETPGTIPPYWSLEPDASGGQRLRYAARGGGMHALVVALGCALMAGAAWAIHWLTGGEGETTIAGWVFAALVPGGAMLLGAYMLDQTLWARTDYVFAQGAIRVRRISLFRPMRADINIASVVSIERNHTPPGSSDPTGSEGRWAVLLIYKSPTGREEVLALDGMGSQREGLWLSATLAAWTRAPVKKGFAAGYEEADAADLPSDDDA